MKFNKVCKLFTAVSLATIMAFGSVSVYAEALPTNDSLDKIEPFVDVLEDYIYETNDSAFVELEVASGMDVIDLTTISRSRSNSIKSLEMKEVTFESDVVIENFRDRSSLQTRGANNTPATATYVNMNSGTNGTADGSNAWYYFNVNTNNTKINVHLSAMNNSDYDIGLFKLDMATGNLNLVEQSTYGQGWAENLGYIASTGTYYVVAQPWSYGGTESFTLSVYGGTVYDNYEVNDNIWNATPINNSANITINTDNKFDEDWFVVNMQPTAQNPYHCISIAGNPVGHPNDYIFNYYALVGNSLIPVASFDAIQVPAIGYHGPDSIWNLGFGTGTYYIQIVPTNYTNSRTFNFKITPNSGVTNYATDDFVQLGTTVESYLPVAIYSGSTYYTRITYGQLRQSMITGEIYYATFNSNNYTGTQAQCTNWLNNSISNLGLRKFGNLTINYRG